MDYILLYLMIQAAFIAMAFWEAYIEGENGWAGKQCGWKVNLGLYTLTAYHFWLFYIFIPILLYGIPFALVGYSPKLFIVLTFSYFSGIILEDFTWFIVNPRYPFSKWNPNDTTWYKWIRFKKLFLPASYVFFMAMMFGLYLIYIKI